MKQREILLCKYGEIVLKGANRKYFEDMLCREMKKRARAYGSFDIYRSQSTIYIEPKDEYADFSEGHLYLTVLIGNSTREATVVSVEKEHLFLLR